MSYAPLSLAVALAAVLLALPGTARAEGGGGGDAMGSVDWTKFYGAAEGVMRGKFVHEEPAHRAANETRDAQTTHPQPASVGNSWFGVEPKVSVVARDWGEGYRLYGAPMALSDELRLSRSTRMVLARVRLGSGRITPFVQLGAGQWRIDTSALPAMHYAVEIATQTGLGVEAKIAKHWDMVVEANSTYFIRDQRQDTSVDGTRVLAAAVFSRMTF